MNCQCDITQPNHTVKTGMCPDVATRKLIATTVTSLSSCQVEKTCWHGIPTDLPPTPTVRKNDTKFAAAFLAAAADKTGAISADMVVYINSILGINKVIGYSAYDTEGNPAPGAINYSVNPVYFDFYGIGDQYNRISTMDLRSPVKVLRGAPGGPWSELNVPLDETTITFRNLMLDKDTYLPNNTPAGTDILGFTQMADDNLRVINFIHTYQIPALR